MCAISRGKWKLLHLYEYDSDELYDVENDIGEQHDLIKKHPELAKELKTALMKWMNDVGAPKCSTQ